MYKKSQLALILSLLFLIIIIVIGVWVFINAWNSSDITNITMGDLINNSSTFSWKIT
jgi:hypothetical protein